MSLLSVPRSTSGSKRNSARLDLLSLVINSPEANPSGVNSPCDSLSPLDAPAKELQERGRVRTRKAVELSREVLKNDGVQTLQEPDLTCHGSQPTNEPASRDISTIACSPRCQPLLLRAHRPSNLKLTRTNGLTSLPIEELKLQIRTCDGHTNTSASITEQVSQHQPKGAPQSHPLPQPSMGNKPSSIAGSPEPDDASAHSVVRRPVRMLRKSSTNLFKRVDSKSPLPRELTASTILHVKQQISPTMFDGSNATEDNDSPIDPFMECNRISAVNSPDPGVLEHPRSASTLTPSQDDTLRPLSSTTTIRDVRVDGRRGSRVETRTSFIENLSSEADDKPQTAPPSAQRGLTLSPSIPAPSPLPEDSPHKYGLKDRMDTPEIPEPEQIDVVKARRRSSGIDIFNEAKSLQSASSFLNGLSTSRRRAESTHRSTETSGWTHASYDTTRPSSARPPSRPSSMRPSSAVPENTFYTSERRRGHTFKPSGFAYTRPLTIAQLSCYRAHGRMLPSRNKTAPVECSVCHIDDDQEHFSCSWCALRMCRFCRKDFAERGMTALKGRIKRVELGGGSEGSSSESVENAGGQAGRGRRVFG